MKIPLILLAFISVMLFADDGYKVYKRHCSSCHMVALPYHEPDRTAAKKKMKAPTMRMVAMRLKTMINIQNEDEDIQQKVMKAFIKEYIVEPDEDYAICMQQMIERFGIMPPIEGLTHDEKEAVAQWLWEQY